MSDRAVLVRHRRLDQPDADSGGVHINSGIPNHAYALMVDGGSYNGRTVTGIGLAKAAKIRYRALTTYLTSGVHVPRRVQRAQPVVLRSDRHLRHHGVRLHAGHDRAAGRRDEPARGPARARSRRRRSARRDRRRSRISMTPRPQTPNWVAELRKSGPDGCVAAIRTLWPSGHASYYGNDPGSTSIHTSP